jgi:hypothetical protein
MPVIGISFPCVRPREPPEGASGRARGLHVIQARRNSAGYAGRLYDSLRSGVPCDSEVFMDMDSLRGGVDFEAQIAATVARCDAFLVLLGPDGPRLLMKKDSGD